MKFGRNIKILIIACSWIENGLMNKVWQFVKIYQIHQTFLSSSFCPKWCLSSTFIIVNLLNQWWMNFMVFLLCLLCQYSLWKSGWDRQWGGAGWDRMGWEVAKTPVRTPLEHPGSETTAQWVTETSSQQWGQV